MGKLYIGTSGWVYGHWEGVFYPESLSSKDKLKYFSKKFKTVEINYSFYHLPRPKTYQNWYLQTPRGFLFAVKASRFITHIKRLKGVKNAWQQFLENSLHLKEKLGPTLFQFPPSFKATSENIKRLEQFLSLLRIDREQFSDNLRFAMEFRHQTWCDKKIYNLLKKYKVSWVIADSPRYPKIEVVTADFVYIRMHGSEILFSSKYTDKELKDLSQKIKKYLSAEALMKAELKPFPKRNRRKGLDVYVYFNNDAQGFAIENAKKLLKLCQNWI